MTYYEVLGIAREAGDDEVKKAYRRHARRTHPDAGGVREDFERVQRAYEVISDPERRRRYDETGGDDTDPPHPPAAEILASAFGHALGADLPGNVLEITRAVLDERLRVERNNVVKAEREMKRWKRMLGRLQRAQGEPVLERVLEMKIAPHQVGAERARAWVEGLMKAMILLNAYHLKREDGEEVVADLLTGLGSKMAGGGKSKPRRRAA